jgi:hypothetical protein
MEILSRNSFYHKVPAVLELNIKTAGTLCELTL